MAIGPHKPADDCYTVPTIVHKEYATGTNSQRLYAVIQKARLGLSDRYQPTDLLTKHQKSAAQLENE